MENINEKYCNDLKIKKQNVLNKITCVILTRDEEMYIQQCIESIIRCVDKIIIVDTGSIDSTLSIISDYDSDKIDLYFFKWNNNFSEVRNYAISKVDYGWVFFIDADEVLDEKMDYQSLHDYLKGFENNKYMKHLVLSPVIIDVGTEQRHKNIHRIFLKNDDLYYFGTVHEQIRSKKNEIKVINTKIKLFHYGYLKQVILKKDKYKRNLELLEKMIEIEPNCPRWSYMYLQDGFEILDTDTLENVIKSAIFIDRNGSIVESNIKKNSYTFGFLVYLCKIKIIKKEFTDVIRTAEIMNCIVSNNSDSFFFTVLAKYLILKNKLEELLFETLNYRKNNFDIQDGMINTNGYHIDCLISILLFEIGDYKRAKKYFDFLKEKLNGTTMEDILNLLKENFAREYE